MSRNPRSIGLTTAGVAGTRGRVLTAVRASADPIGIEELAQRLDLHPNTVRFHAEALESDGMLSQEREQRVGRGRPKILYRPTRAGSRGGERNYQLLAAMLVEHLSAGSPDPLPAAREAGRHWGRRLAGDTGSHRSGVTGSGGTGSSGTGSSEAVAELLGDMGFEPEPVAGGIALRNCPFREIVDDNQPVVCAIHEGMLDVMLEQPPEGSTTRRGIALEPFAAPEGCLVRLDPQGYER